MNAIKRLLAVLATFLVLAIVVIVLVKWACSSEEREICPTDRAPVCNEICPQTRRVGRCLGEDLQDFSGWTETPIQEQVGLQDAELLGSDLENICIFELAEGDDAAPQPPGSQPDCKVGVSAPATPWSPEEWEVLERSFLADALGVASSSFAEPPFTAAQSSVLVAVVDAAPSIVLPSGTDEPVAANGRHGRAMASLVRQIACWGQDPATCPVDVRAFLALPRLRDGTFHAIEGGFHGYQSDVAAGLAKAIATWEAMRKEASPSLKLVINLSLGWEQVCEQGSSLVRDQLERVNGNPDVLVLAANGNRIIGTCVTGPTAPASWETDGLVHGITALDDEGQPLVTVRPQSNTRIAARGSAGVTVGPNGTQYGPLTGSSVATAVVSGITARLWTTQAPSEPARRVIDLLWSRGLSNGTVVADVFPPGVSPAPEQRIVSLCLALEWGPCLALGLSPMHHPLAPKPVNAIHIAPGDRTSVECDHCGRLERTWVGSGTGNVDHPPPLSTWVLPQPGHMLCPACGIRPAAAPAEAWLRIDEAHDPSTVKSITITLWNGSIGETHVYDEPSVLYPLQSNPPGQWVIIEDSEFATVGGGAPTQGYVSMDFADYSAGNDLAIWP